MPWRRSQAYRRVPPIAIIASAILAVCIGVLIGYTRWGTTASIVELVEHQLSETQQRINALEKRLGSLESRLGGGKLDTSAVLNSPFATAAGGPESAESKPKPVVAKPNQ